jgi:hypothetical protein
MTSQHNAAVEQLACERKAKSGKWREAPGNFPLSAFGFPLLGTSAGLSHLALHTGRAITELAAELHAVIARRWRIFDEPDATRAPLPYHIVAESFSALAQLASAEPRDDDSGTTSDAWRRFVSALNGVLGDKLAAWDSPLAIAMSVRGADGAALELAALRAASRRGVVLFVHGLCASDGQWHSAGHRALVGRLEASGFGVGWLRYNSGRAIPDNGRDFAALLDAAFGREVTEQELVLIGHSMGGLLIRSACHVAGPQGQPWLRRLSHAAYLGSPHHGVPLERAGNIANAVLGLTPYSAPFMRVGNVRSRGIKDLRFGCVAPEESAAATDACFSDRRRSIVPLPEHVRHLLVAGSLDSPAGASWIGDGLVPMPSALAEHCDSALTATAAQVQRAHVSPIGHIALMHDARTCALLATWLGVAGAAPRDRAAWPAGGDR